MEAVGPVVARRLAARPAKGESGSVNARRLVPWVRSRLRSGVRAGVGGKWAVGIAKTGTFGVKGSVLMRFALVGVAGR